MRISFFHLLWMMIAFVSPLTASAVEPVKPPKKAKAIIQVWLWGGVPHIDTFDPKPNAGRDFCGPYTSPIQTNVEGIKIGQMLPQLAKIADKYTILRGMTHGNNGHETAAYLIQTGFESSGDLSYPSVGAIVTHFLGQPPLYKSPIPPYITLTTAQGRFAENGFLPTAYKPFATGGDPNAKIFSVEGIVCSEITDARQDRRRELLKNIDQFSKIHAENKDVKSLLTCRQNAYEMILNTGKKIFSLSEEPDSLRDRYGRNRIGQSCILARRLVENGAIFVTVNLNGWDTHKEHFQAMNNQLPQLDSAVSTLIRDLDERGMLDETIVWVASEFGRTPEVDWSPPWNGGRGHYGPAFSHLVAGGGFKGGCVVGVTDEKGRKVVERPIYPWDLIASFYYLMGIDPKTQMEHPLGFKVPITPFGDTKKPMPPSGGILTEVMK